MRKRAPHKARISFSTGFGPGQCAEAPVYETSAPGETPASEFLRRIASRCLMFAEACEKNEGQETSV